MQNMNRYSYVWNNPLRYTDPSGYVGVEAGRYENASFTGTNGQTISGTIIALDEFDKRTTRSEGSLGLGPSDWAQLASVAINIAGAALNLPPILTNFVASFVSSLIQGGSFNVALKAGFKGAAIGAVSAFASGFVGGLTAGIPNDFLKYGAKALGHGLTQGTITAVQGQNFWHGFAAGAVAGAGESITSVFKVGDHGLMSSGSVLHYSVGAAMGGLSSKISGGKWSTGAISGVMVLAYNQNESNNRDLDSRTDDHAKNILGGHTKARTAGFFGGVAGAAAGAWIGAQFGSGFGIPGAAIGAILGAGAGIYKSGGLNQLDQTFDNIWKDINNSVWGPDNPNPSYDPKEYEKLNPNLN